MATEQPKPRATAPMAEVRERFAPWKPAPWEPSIATAFQALARGDCPGHLQQAAVRWLLEECCKTYDQPFRPGGPEGERDTTFALGKQWVGQQVVKLINTRVHKGGEQG